MGKLCGQSYGFFRDARCETGESPRGKSRMPPTLYKKAARTGWEAVRAVEYIAPKGTLSKGIVQGMTKRWVSVVTLLDTRTT